MALNIFGKKYRVLGNSIVSGQRLSTELTAETTTIPALAMAIKRKGRPQIFHSDRGSQYLCSVYKKLLNDGKMIKQSNSYSCYGNAVTESFFKTLKTEIEKKKFKSLEEAKIELFKWIEVFYNRKRMHSSIGYMSPIEFRKKLTA
jgi:transposase InsO family protein